jgi:hypothetical protein
VKARFFALTAGALACGLLLSIHPAANAALDPTKANVIFDWETDTQGWTSGIDTSKVTHNSDAQFASEGSKGSLQVNLTGHNSWSDQIMTVALPAPLDLSKFAFVSVDVYVPAGSRGGDTSPTWAQFGLITGDPYINLGSHDIVREGWQHFVWSLDPEKSKNITFMRFFVNQGAPWAAPIYFDNLKVLPGQARGLTAKDQILIDGFNKAANIEGMAEDWPREITTDKAYVTEGDGALKLDITDQQGWSGYKDAIIGLPPIDLSTMDQLRLDVFLPDASAPDWYQLGVSLVSGDAAAYVPDAIHGFNKGWQTLVWDFTRFTADQKALLKEITGFRFFVQSGTAFLGPVYVDALRGSKEMAGVEAVPAGVKGDVNGNGKLDISDVVAALRFVAGLATPTAAQTAAADVNANGKVDISDIVALLRAVAGLSTL